MKKSYKEVELEVIRLADIKTNPIENSKFNAGDEDKFDNEADY